MRTRFLLAFASLAAAAAPDASAAVLCASPGDPEQWSTDPEAGGCARNQIIVVEQSVVVIAPGGVVVVPANPHRVRQLRAAGARPVRSIVAPSVVRVVPSQRFTTGGIGPFTTGSLGPFTTGSLAPFTTSQAPIIIDGRTAARRGR
jgi:hypothetical protein